MENIKQTLEKLKFFIPPDQIGIEMNMQLSHKGEKNALFKLP